MSHAPRPSLAHNACFSLLGSGLYALTQWGQVAVLARLGDAHHVGVFACALALTAPIMLCAGLQLRSLQATDVQGEFLLGHYLALRLAGIAVALAMIALLAVLAGRGADQTLAILAMGVAKGVEAVGEIGHGALHRHERHHAIAMSQALRGIAGLAGLWGGFLATGTVAGAIAGLALAWLAVLLAWDLPSTARFCGAGWRPRWQAARLAQLTRTAAPLGAAVLLLSLATFLPYYVIEWRLGTTALGHFAGVVWLLVGGKLAILALGNTLSPRLAGLLAAGDQRAARALLRRALWLAIMLGAALSAGCLVGGRWLLELAYGPHWGDHSALLAWLAAGMTVGWVGSLLGYYVTAGRRLRVQLPIACCALLVSAMASLLLIPAHHLTGAAWAVCSMSSVLAACYAWAACGIGDARGGPLPALSKPL